MAMLSARLKGRIGTEMLGICVLLALSVLLTGCSGIEDTSAPPPEAPASTVGLTAEEIIVGVGDLVPAAGEVRLCVGDRLEGEPGLVEVGQSVTPGSPAYLTIQRFVDECSSSAGQADPFVELEGQRSAEPMTDEQKACLKAAFIASPRDVVEALLSEGIEAPAGSPAAEALAGMESRCGVDALAPTG